MFINRISIAFSIIVLHLMLFSALYAQNNNGNNLNDTTLVEIGLPSGNESDELNTTNIGPAPNETGLHVTQLEDTITTTPDSSKDSSSTENSSQPSNSVIDQTIMEQILLTELEDSLSKKRSVGCFFILRSKPSDFSYEIKEGEMKLIFTFNDTKVGATPFPSVSAPLIKGFIVQQDKIDSSKHTTGSESQLRFLTRVVFDLEAIPDIKVTDEQSIISFTYEQAPIPSKKQKKVMAKYLTRKNLLLSSIGVGGAAAIGLAVYLIRESDSDPAPSPPSLGILSTTDLPEYPSDFK